jgi:suppressor of tumorigenicity protein 13
MGDVNKVELTDEESNAFDAKKSEALSAFGEGEWEKAIGLFTEAIRISAQSSVVFAKRGTCYLKLKRPNACIRDCDRAIELNPDSAPAYKFRGRAHEYVWIL